VVEQKNLQEYHTVILAAFLHDIGKLVGRGSFKILDRGQHPEFSATFISAHHKLFSPVTNIKLLQELVRKHHENQKAFPPEPDIMCIEPAGG
jgi:metal-dependent HD superfamily phosphatase/phosphodiesterase